MNNLSENKINVLVDGKSVQATAGALISDLVWIKKPCGGHGKCGKCKVIARGNLSEPEPSEIDLLGEELEKGARLACRARVLGECEIFTEQNHGESKVETGGNGEVVAKSPAFAHYGVAIDIGTTTIAGKLFSLEGKALAVKGSLNPQAQFGADVISRIEFALSGGAEKLRLAVIGEIDGIIKELATTAGVEQSLVDGAVITGNTVMLSLLTATDVEPLSHAPFVASSLFGYAVTAQRLGLKSLSPEIEVYLPRCVSAFVGADITCAMTATDFDQKNDSVLVDVGTNGEIAFVSNGSISVCSTAAGPAFEGVGITCGMGGEEGAIDKVSIVNGRYFASVIGLKPAKGICGSGIIDAIACMLDTEDLDITGYLEDDVAIAGEVVITQKDVRAVQLAKSAVCAGIKTLISDVSEHKIQELIVAGGFGSKINMKSAGRIGLIPPSLTDKATAVGNASLTGASMILLDKGQRERSRSVAENARLVELATNKTFISEYTEGMLFDEA